MIILINGNMSCKCVRPITNRSVTLLTATKGYHIKIRKEAYYINGNLSFIICILQLFIHSKKKISSVLTMSKPLEKEIFQVFQFI